MYKRLIALIAAFLLLNTGAVFGFDDIIDITLNEEYICADVIIKNGTALAPVRSVAAALNAEAVVWYPEHKTAELKIQDKNIFIDTNNDIIYIQAVPYAYNTGAGLLNNITYVPVRLICELLGAEVKWDSHRKNVEIYISEYTAPKNSINTAYTGDELLWLARIIQAESGGEPLKGKIAVGNVIINRIKSNLFPNTVYDVIFDKTHGIQFEPTINGAIYNNPDSESFKAAKHAFSGTDIVGECLYFFNPRTAQSNWISKNRQLYTSIANHDFYL